MCLAQLAPCLWCSGSMPTGRRRDARFCSKLCRQAAFRLRVFGFTLETFRAMLERQDNACGICEVPFIGHPPNIDHDHVTGEVRGILCNYCNRALGRLVDKPGRLDRVMAYLDAPRDPTLRVTGRDPSIR